ncbi:ExeM/NucH family extracellular endonuclease [Deinococcus sp.]|uniref:ExeM/NucH family extracellular endonuclease n=1 Tax=Deinococcus sp. TaxID=47478 RepID=UPI0025C1CE97|nr:ExeM/NucH family extracellular endonuclease [Deinococcus sp.]
MNIKPTRFVLLLAGALALASCGQQKPLATTTSTPASKPAPVVTNPAKSLGLFELNINGVGSQQLQASVSRPGLSAQAAEVQGLNFALLSNSTVTDNVNKVLHLTTSFTVTNTSGAPISLPTYIPVDTSGAYATDDETPFRNVVSRKGVPMSGVNMTPEQSNRLSGGAVGLDPSATPLVGNLDTGALQISLPSGTTAPGISHTGWQTTTLAPGASQVVNFAVRVPLQGVDVGDNDPFRFTLVFTVADNPGTVNLTRIGSVQGSTPAGDVGSPMNAQAVTVEGVVTSALPGLIGFFMQEAGIDKDSDGTTSDGIFVYCVSNCPSTGSRVRVAGTVTEYKGAKGTDTQGVTEITSPTVTVLASSVPAPAPVSLTLPLNDAQLERYEGMRVTFPETLTVTNNYTYGRYGELDLSNNGRMFVPSNGNAKTGQSAITLDDGISAQNPLNLNYLSSENTRRTGDTVTGLTGIWHTIASLPMLEPEGAVNFVSANSRAANATPASVGGSLRVVGANMLNFFTTFTNGATFDGKTGQGCLVGTSTTAANCRGANNLAEFQRQRAKMVQTITALNPDVLSVMETQNDDNVTMNEIVRALNEKAGAGTYAAVQTGRVGTDAIRVGLIYKPGKVAPIGQPMIDTNSIYSRPPVAQTFRDLGTNGVFSVVSNHLKSKGSCPTSGDTDQGQGCWNQLRVQQASQLLNFVSTIKQTSGDQDVLLLGDFNAYGAEDPVKTIQNGGFESLNLRIPAEDRYSYQFGGLFGYLDHAFSSTNLSTQVTGITEWHVNSDEPVIADYNAEYKAIPECGTATTCIGKDLYSATNPFRASDHDPVLVGLSLTADAGSTPAPSTPATSLSASPTALSVTAGGAATSSTLTTSTQNYSGADLSISTSNSAGLTVMPSATTVSPNGTFSVNITVPATTPSGTYPVTVTTTGQSGLSANTTINVTVTGGALPPATSLNHLVISQVYGGGGNTGATYTNDFIEIFNPTSSAINLAGYSVQYASATGTSWQVTPLSSYSLAPGQFYLVQEAKGAGGTVALTPNTTDTIAMSGSAGQVVLAQKTTAVTGTTDAAVNDYVAYSGLSSTTSASRTNVCADTNASSDFASGAVNPRNTATALNVCP